MRNLTTDEFKAVSGGFGQSLSGPIGNQNPISDDWLNEQMGGGYGGPGFSSTPSPTPSPSSTPSGEGESEGGELVLDTFTVTGGGDSQLSTQDPECRTTDLPLVGPVVTCTLPGGAITSDPLNDPI